MTVIIDGTTGISTPGEAVSGNLSYTGTLTGSTGVVNFGSGQVYKDASGNVGIGTSSPAGKIDVQTGTNEYSVFRSTVAGADIFLKDSGTTLGNVRLRGISNAMAFIAGGDERARIDSSGNLLVGTTSGVSSEPGARVGFYSSSTTAMGIVGPAPTAWVLKVGSTSASGQRQMIGFCDTSAATVGGISHNGTTVSYATSSDYRLKDTIAPMTGALAKVAALKPCTYKWKVDGSDGQGFIAHELAEVEPGCVTGEKDAVDVEGNPQYQGIDTSFLVATLTAAIQEQQTLITALTARITALETA